MTAFTAERLTRLGTQEWNHARARVREAVSIVAADLLRLYAARQLLNGHAFREDTQWQQELEAAFPYEETDDQLRAIREVKADMESAEDLEHLVEETMSRFGRVDLLVNNAAATATRTWGAPMLDLTREDLMSQFAVNLHAPYKERVATALSNKH